MTQWYVKDLSKITHVSVQTLHHYDRISLLKPSVRLPNGYRLYSENDLSKLQQIIALKSFGFELAKIKNMLVDEVDAFEHFVAQAEYLANKAKALSEASNSLKTIIAGCSEDKSIPWETITKLIEVYHMTQQLENSWEGKVLNQEELKEYAQFEQELKTRFTPEQRQVCEADWADIVKQVNANLSRDPHSEVGKTLGKRCMDWVNKLYGKQHAALRSSIWEKGFKGDNVDGVYGLSPESVKWLDQAIDAYYSGRISSVLNRTQNQSDATRLQEWNELLTDMYGNSDEMKEDFIGSVLRDETISEEGKGWLMKNVKK